MNFIILGLGYISSKHLIAIHNIGGNLVAAHDPSQSNIGKLDNHFPDCKYFPEFELFDDYVQNIEIDYAVVCTPNHLHFNHIKYGLCLGAKVICEKPIVIEDSHYQKLLMYSDDIYPMLQLRANKDIAKCKKNLSDKHHNVKINYITQRGDWYDATWQMEYKKSGGLYYNIGIHPLDICCFLFGKHEVTYKVNDFSRVKICKIEFEKATVQLVLAVKEYEGYKRYRTFNIDGEEINMTTKFRDLHTTVYERILNNDWYTIADLENTMCLLDELRS